MTNMDNNGFCIILPCNSSTSVYPDNQISNYRTKLAKPIDWKGDWEVGLVEFHGMVKVSYKPDLAHFYWFVLS